LLEQQMTSPVTLQEDDTLLSPSNSVISPQDEDWMGATFYPQQLNYVSGSNDRSYETDFFAFDVSGL
jgi:hypothetical protein